MRCISAADLKAGERVLLKDAREWMMRLPFFPIDFLMVEKIGKNVSVSGMDTNVIGGPLIPFETLKFQEILFEPRSPNTR